MVEKTFNILFVCRHNRFRSKFAESYFKKINKNKNIKTQSAGIFPGPSTINKLEIKVSNELKVTLSGKPKPVKTKLLNWNNLIVLITNDVPNPHKLFNYATFKNKVIT